MSTQPHKPNGDGRKMEGPPFPPPAPELPRDQSKEPTLEVTSYSFRDPAMNRDFMRKTSTAVGPYEDLSEKNLEDNQTIHRNIVEEHCDGVISGVEKEAGPAERALARDEPRLQEAKKDRNETPETRTEVVEGQQNTIPWTAKARFLRGAMTGGAIIGSCGSAATAWRTLSTKYLEFAGQNISAGFVMFVFLLVAAGFLIFHEFILEEKKAKKRLAIAALIPGLSLMALFIVSFMLKADSGSEEINLSLSTISLDFLREDNGFDILSHPFLLMLGGEILITSTCIMFLFELLATYGRNIPKTRTVQNEKFVAIKREIKELEEACDRNREIINLRDQLRLKKAAFVNSYVMKADAEFRAMHAEHRRHYQERSR